ncbi:MAG: hypothetical protein CL912_12025 [Deltaproteobacteria bacterium]|nr:hypothetical protein [Deltaproteobacteria bacterium]
MFHQPPTVLLGTPPLTKSESSIFVRGGLHVADLSLLWRFCDSVIKIQVHILFIWFIWPVCEDSLQASAETHDDPSEGSNWFFSLRILFSGVA